MSSKRVITLKTITEFIGITHFVGITLYGGQVASLLLYLGLLYRGHYLLFIAYNLWFLYDCQTPFHGGAFKKWLSDLIVWKYLSDFFPMRLVKTAELPCDKNYFFISHPHGILAIGPLVTFATDGNGFSKTFPGVKVAPAGLKMLFFIPIFREYIRANIIAATTDSIEYKLTKCGPGHSVALVPGGTRELLETRPGGTTLFLRSRKGFSKIALRTGASLVPVFTFGENEIYQQLHNYNGFKWLKNIWIKMVKTVGFSFIMPTSFYPKKRPLIIVFGAPITVEKTLHPTEEQIDNLHTRYITALTELFETHKMQYSMRQDQHLEFI